MTSQGRAVRAVADRYVRRLAELDPSVATFMGGPESQHRLPDLSPAGRLAQDDLSRSTLSELDAAEREARRDGGLSDAERRCGRLLSERLKADLAASAGQEHLRDLLNIFGLQQSVQGIFLMMPTSAAGDWAAVAARMRCVPAALAGLRESLTEAAGRGNFTASPRQVNAVAAQLDDWLSDAGGRGWYAGFCAGADAGTDVLPPLRKELDAAAAAAASALAGLRDWLRTSYLARAADTPDGVGPERYGMWARYWNGVTLDPHEVYDWGWAEYLDLLDQMRKAAGEVLPDAQPLEAMRHLDEQGEAVDGVEEIRARLQRLMDETISELNGRHFDLADPVRVVEARIAPPGRAAAPYYTRPSQDFSRPGRTWLPVLGRTRFPLWRLLSVWYHEGVPGHHLQLAQWIYVADQLSVYQTSIGGISACKEGWALYAERLMDELGYLRTPGDRLGFLDWQLTRAIRVIVDIGMHLSLRIPPGSPVGAGQKWTPALAREFLAAQGGHPAGFVDSEIVRYLGRPGQAICYKLGERAWLAGRETARARRAARGEAFDLKSWHMAALSAGSLGLDDLVDELGRL